MSKNKFWNYAGLHFALLSWGAAGITSNLMTIPPAGIVIYRAFIATVALSIFNQIADAGRGTSIRDKIYMVLTGMMIGLHWWGFFTAIKVSTVSIALVCISSAPIFVAVLQPFIEKIPIKPSQIVLGVVSVIGIGSMFKFESQYQLGILIGLAAGAIDAVYSVMTSRTREGIANTYVTQMHMLGAFLVVFALYPMSGGSFQWLVLKANIDYFGVIFLGLVCSAVAMSLYVQSIKELSAFTATLSLNLEAVYGIALALMIFGEREYLSPGFYVGASLLVGSVVTDAVLRVRSQQPVVDAV